MAANGLDGRILIAKRINPSWKYSNTARYIALCFSSRPEPNLIYVIVLTMCIFPCLAFMFGLKCVFVFFGVVDASDTSIQLCSGINECALSKGSFTRQLRRYRNIYIYIYMQNGRFGLAYTSVDVVLSNCNLSVFTINSVPIYSMHIWFSKSEYVCGCECSFKIYHVNSAYAQIHAIKTNWCEHVRFVGTQHQSAFARCMFIINITPDMFVNHRIYRDMFANVSLLDTFELRRSIGTKWSSLCYSTMRCGVENQTA